MGSRTTGRTRSPTSGSGTSTSRTQNTHSLSSTLSWKRKTTSPSPPPSQAQTPSLLLDPTTRPLLQASWTSLLPSLSQDRPQRLLLLLLLLLFLRDRLLLRLPLLLLLPPSTSLLRVLLSGLLVPRILPTAARSSTGSSRLTRMLSTRPSPSMSPLFPRKRPRTFVLLSSRPLSTSSLLSRLPTWMITVAGLTKKRAMALLPPPLPLLLQPPNPSSSPSPNSFPSPPRINKRARHRTAQSQRHHTAQRNHSATTARKKGPQSPPLR